MYRYCSLLLSILTTRKVTKVSTIQYNNILKLFSRLFTKMLVRIAHPAPKFIDPLLLSFISPTNLGAALFQISTNSTHMLFRRCR